MKRTTLFILAGILAICFFASGAYAGTQVTSGATAATIIAKAKTDLNDASTTFVSDSELITWINEAAIDIVASARCLEYSASVTLAADTWAYSLTTASYDVESAMYDNEDTDDDFRFYALDRTDVKELYSKEMRKRGRPVQFFVWDDYFCVWPVPSSTETGANVYLMGLAMPTAITLTTNSIETPKQYDALYVVYIKAKYYEKDGKENRANYYRSMYYQRIAQIRMETSKKLVTDYQKVGQ